MTDPIQAAIERAEEAADDYAIMTSGVDSGAHTQKEAQKAEATCRATIRKLAALVREYGHVAQCQCHNGARPPFEFCGCDVHHTPENPYRDDRCLPESREVKHGE